MPCNFDTSSETSSFQRLLEFEDCINDFLTPLENKIIRGIQSETEGLDRNVDNTRNQVLNSLKNQTRDIRSSISNSTSIISSNINRITNNLNGSLGSITDKVTSFVGIEIGGLENDLRDVQSNILKGISGKTSDLSNDINDAENKISRNISNQTNTIQSAVSRSENNINDAINYGFTVFANSIGLGFDSLNEGFSGFIKDATKIVGMSINEFNKSMLDQFKAIENILKKLENNEYNNWQEFINDINQAKLQGDLWQYLFRTLGLVNVFVRLTQLSWLPAMERLEQLSNASSGHTLLTPEQLIRLWYSYYIDNSEYYKQMGYHGYSQQNADLAIQASENLLNEDMIRQLYLRGNIDDKTKKGLLEKIGYRSDSIANMTLLYDVIPPIQDLIRMSVREVFTPEIANKFGQYEAYPEELTKYAAKHGLNEEWSKRFWAAHWTLPSSIQGFQMFHRRIIDENTLKMLLQSLDITPYWQDKLVHLSYNPLTRVDVRRMHKLGVIDRGQVYESYLDIGYSPENAERLTQFTETYNQEVENTESEEIRSVTRSIIERAYRLGIIDKHEAKERLSSIGYDSNDAELLLSIQDELYEQSLIEDKTEQLESRLTNTVLKAYSIGTISTIEASQLLNTTGYSESEASTLLSIVEIEQDFKVKTEFIQAVKELYNDGILDDTEFIGLLSKNGFTSEETQELLSEISMFKQLKPKKPSRTDFRNFYLSGILTLEEYKRELSNMGYSEKYIDMYVKYERED